MTTKPRQRLLSTTVAVICAALVLPLAAPADDGNDRKEVRVVGTCTGSSRASLRLRADDGSIRVEFEVDSGRAGSAWKVIVLHERRIAFRAALRSGSGGSVKFRQTLPDWFGTDRIVVRATGPRGASCRASASV
jgi:hypothetical protein